MEQVTQGDYTWRAPKAREGEWVFFRDRWDTIRIGFLESVETKYDGDGVAWHTYTVRRQRTKSEFYKRPRGTWFRTYISEEDFRGIAPQQEIITE